VWQKNQVSSPQEMYKWRHDDDAHEWFLRVKR